MIKPNIQFLNNDRTPSLQARKELKAFLMKIFRTEKRTLENLAIIFCSDEYLLEVNKQFLAHDYFTDIITFDLTEPGSPTSAELYISIDRVKDNAKNLGTTFKRELHRVIFHGCLHLCGYKDKKPNEIAIMRRKEDHYLFQYFQ